MSHSMEQQDLIQRLKSKVTPTPCTKKDLTAEAKLKIIESHFTEIMDALGLDLTDDSLQDTPRRVAKMFVKELFTGLDWNTFPKITTVENKMNTNQPVTVKDINVMSVCEHHFVTITGKAIVSYIPNKKVLGLSKFNRVVDFFCRRPQIQERLTQQIAEALMIITESDDVAVYIDAKHYCMIARGIEDVNASTTTYSLHGKFNKEYKEEFLSTCRR